METENKLPDSAERERAATTFDRNVVVTAGAGTGKTTLLVDRMVHLLMRNPEPLDITQIVALTFTNKAANEMRVRLRERLQSYLSARLDAEPAGEDEAKTHAELHALIRRYRLTKDQIDGRAREALRRIERSSIGTIHSFAATLLRLYPMEAAVDPQFREDEGSHFEKHFDEQWSVWLDGELGRNGGRHQLWKRVLKKIPLENLREIAASLCSEVVPLKQLAASSEELEPVLRDWLAHLQQSARELIRRYPEDRFQIDRFARHCLEIVTTVLTHGGIPENELREEARWFSEKSLRRAGDWTEEDFSALQRLCRIARAFVLTNRALSREIWELLTPFAGTARDSFIKKGFVSFDGLLVRARDLLRDHRHVREELKYLYSAILIDEFQDTDPIQYEILLYLAEKPGGNAHDWRSIRLAQGKVFVVGDPKQSIYAFRRADIQGYLEVVREIILAQDGIECPLTTNFRSHSRILDVVNGVFGPLIRAREGLQPSYVPIQPPKDRKGDPATSGLPFRNVTFRRIESENEMKAGPARILEAESLARWLADDVLGKARIIERGETVTAQPRHVAFLFRKLTSVHFYLESLRRRGIRYVVEGEKHFYATQEVVDAVNLLRAVGNPYDQAALVGVLRSAVGGLSDPEIYGLHGKGLLDYRKMKRAGDSPARELDQVRDLYQALERLHRETRDLAVADAVNLTFETIPIRILAARSFNGEQAVANLEKIRQQVALMGREGLATLKDVVARLERRVLEVEEEGESALAEEVVDAVRILSIHKAKGLEFPIVVLPDAGAEPLLGRSEPGVQYDWSSNLIGLQTTGHTNLGGIFLAEKRRLREEEEQKRVFYVAMTRAREHLTISRPPAKPRNGSFCAMLEKAIQDPASFQGAGPLLVGEGSIEIQAVAEKHEAPKRLHKEPQGNGASEQDWSSFFARWNERARHHAAALGRPLFVTPTLLKRNEIQLAEGFAGRAGAASKTDPLAIGTLVHHFLEEWNFSVRADRLEETLTGLLERWPESALGRERSAVLEDCREILRAFFASEAYRELCSVRILGREVPLLMPWDGQIMEGVIDLIYEKKGKLYLADYKTDRVERKDLPRLAATYRLQAQIYSEAARKSLGRPVAGFRLLFLRLGEGFDIALDRHSIQGSLPF